ncbi:Phage-related protein [Streptococcus henryi]|uniref:Phage-related protein n=1 Tax=Streptococcus henryi TaxID=439219 RepID=A0A1G6DNU1_9STRE|nr:type II toxin-antitoxin system RelE/ParE family toxin [Streptococcus henryi]SDB46808.1 Phage-related protein [Streptococcus henryi]
MHKIHFYKDKHGNQPVADYIRLLQQRKDKDSRIKAGKILEYIDMLSEHGFHLNPPYIKHLDGEIWELRPIRDRVLFAAWIDGGFILLHQFMKKSQKTPKREIEQAKRELRDILERGIDYEE